MMLTAIVITCRFERLAMVLLWRLFQIDVPTTRLSPSVSSEAWEGVCCCLLPARVCPRVDVGSSLPLNRADLLQS